MTLALRGVAKLMEECGELVQILGKKLAYWDVEIHPDGLPIDSRIEDEIADVVASTMFVCDHLPLDMERVHERIHTKMDLFMTWQAQVDNNEHAVDELAYKAGIEEGHQREAGHQ